MTMKPGYKRILVFKDIVDVFEKAFKFKLPYKNVILVVLRQIDIVKWNKGKNTKKDWLVESPHDIITEYVHESCINYSQGWDSSSYVEVRQPSATFYDNNIHIAISQYEKYLTAIKKQK